MGHWLLVLAILLAGSSNVWAFDECPHDANYISCLNEHARARSQPRVDMQRRDNQAIQEATQQVQREDRVNAIVNSVLSVMTDAPQNPSDTGPKMDNAIKAVRDALSACSECEMERTADREYLTKKILEVAKKRDDERDSQIVSCVHGCPRRPFPEFESCWNNCQKIR